MYKCLLWATVAAVAVIPGIHPAVLAEDIVELGEMTVRARTLPARGHALSRAEMSAGRSINVGEAVTAVPGVDAVLRGADAAEPVIRGLGWERVETQIGCHSLYGACPARMDPPVTYVSPEALESVQVVKGLPSVTLGPGGTGGRVVLDVDYDRGEGAGTNIAGAARVTWNEGRDGHIASVRGQGGSEDVDIRAEAGSTELDDYDSGGGKTVPAGLEETGVNLSLGWRPTDGNRAHGSFIFKEEQDVEFPALPMDTEESSAYIATLGYRVIRDGDALERTSLSAGYSYVDHLMSNLNKPNRKQLEAETPSEAESYSGKLDADWRLGEQLLLTVGADMERLERDATRRRAVTAAGMTFHDHIWPDVTRDIVGTFGELNWDATDALAVRAGGRVDFAESDAAAANDTIRLGMGSPPSTILNQYERFNGPAAGKDDVDEVLFSGNLLAEWQATDETLLYVGAGRVSRYPGVTEQFFAFAPAPGGFQVGNPALDPEDKYEANAGLLSTGERVTTECSLFAAYVEDYINQTRIDRLDVNGDGRLDNIRGFRNVDAELYGGELGATVRLAEGLTLPASVSYVAARNTTDHRDLPEIPPFSGRAALKFVPDSDRAWWCETGLRFAARQSRVDETFPEDETGSFQVFHIKGGVELLDDFALEAGVENLFDEDYNEHLTREALMPAGDLAAGDEVPAPGRYFYLTARIALGG